MDDIAEKASKAQYETLQLAIILGQVIWLQSSGMRKVRFQDALDRLKEINSLIETIKQELLK